MDPNGGAARFRIRKTPSFDRFLGVSTHSCPESAVSSGVVGDEFNEDDVFWTGDFAEHNHKSHPPSNSSSTSRSHPHHGKSIGRGNNFGILAALPVSETNQTNFQTRSVFNHKASVSPSSSSSRMIPAIPKKPPLDKERSLKYHQSAPLNVPVMTEAMRRNRAMRQFDDIDGDNDEGDGEMLPPHEVVESRQSPMVACSVLEGVGRTLKGRDLRQIRNAVWRKTGFLDGS